MQQFGPTTPGFGSGATGAPNPAVGALVIGGAHGSLAVVRSLGRQGIPVWYLTHDHPLTGHSHYVDNNLTWAGPDDPGATEYLLRLAAHNRLHGWTLFTCGDAEVRLVAQNRAALSATYRLTTPSMDIVRWTADKRLTHQYAAQLGLDSPWSYYPKDRRDVAQLDCRFPVILKPTVREVRNRFTQEKAWRADDRDMLLARYDEAAALVGERAIVLQELIPGGGERQFSYAALCDRGEPVAALTARRTRQFPIDFGYTSTFVETIEQSEVEAAARRLLHAFSYTGLVEVEFKYDARDGRYKLLDINARPWTWIGLGAIAGVDFPLLAWRQANGEPVMPVRGAVGARWIHVTRDFVATCQELLAGGGFAALAHYANSFRKPLTFATFAVDDPVPALVELPIVAGRVLARKLSSFRHGAVKAPTVPRPTI